MDLFIVRNLVYTSALTTLGEPLNPDFQIPFGLYFGDWICFFRKKDGNVKLHFSSMEGLLFSQYVGKLKKSEIEFIHDLKQLCKKDLNHEILQKSILVSVENPLEFHVPQDFYALELPSQFQEARSCNVL